MPKKRTLTDDLLGVGVGAVGLAVAGGIAGRAGAPPGVSNAIGATAGFLPVVTGVVVAKHAFKNLKPKKTRRLF